MIDLKGKKLFDLTNPELGWDCVCGVYFAESEEAVVEHLGKDYDEDMDVIHEVSPDEIETKAEIRDAKIDEVTVGEINE